MLIKNHIFGSLFIAVLFFLYLPLESRAQQTATVEGTVVDRATGEGLPGVNIRLLDTSRGTVTGRDGRYSLEIPAGEAELRYSYIGYESRIETLTDLSPGEVRTLDVSLTSSYISGNEVVVTGTRSGGRSNLESAVPIDVISVDDLDTRAPQVDVNQLLTYVAPSFQSNRQSAADESEHNAPASLRGMGPDQLLVLVNGKRRHTSSVINLLGGKRGTVGTDMSVIPTASIDRIEILRDGAAAQYGSDAIAGVINIILKEDTGTLSTSATAGVYREGDGETAKVNANYGFALGEEGYVNITGSFTNREPTNRTGDHDLHVYTPGFAYPFDQNPEEARAADNAEIQARGKTRDDFKFHIGDAGMQIASTFVNGAVPVDDRGTEVYFFGSLSNKQGTGFPFRRLPVDGGNVPEIYPHGFQPLTKSSITDKSITTGIRGEYRGWEIDFSNSFGSNAFDFRVTNSVNATLGASSPTAFDVGGFSFSQNVTGLTFAKRFDRALSGINVAFGSEFRIDNYGITAGDEPSYRNYGIADSVSNGIEVGKVDTLGRTAGSQGYPGFRPADEVSAARTNIAAFGEVEVNLTDDFLVAGATRFERYSDFGNTINGKVSARYLLGRFLTIRGAVNTGFRAPSLHQVYYNKVSSDFNDNNRLVQIGTFNNNSRPADLLGIPDLTEETSINYSLGFTLRPFQNVSLTTDFYQIDVEDRIILTSEFNVSELPGNIAGELREYGVSAANFFTNAIDTRTRGVDLVATYNQPFANGSQLNFSLGANFNEVKVQGAVETSPQLEEQADLYLQPWDRLRLEEGDPQSKVSATLQYDIGRLSAMVRGVRFGEVSLNTGGAFGEPQTYSAKFVTDLSLTYGLSEAVDLTVGSNNVFDVYPDEHLYANSYFNVFKYPPSQHGFNGAYYFTKLTLNY
ncbi:iron complex outermembrane recepter protein [Fodinibius roseus]|uniref:Iron complex outermembrane recepter protein n=1 Tax=Fodinibius roseus TaxID=1194090 RepID=A0A1M4ZGE8_9BACT|nr:TonB-dependent receptor [Fodinibius roseus]SHF17110.1 iron complex outermembrane recepter protein [Fodinibius roseus]